jgi:cytoskeleton protein RodZ
MSEQGENLLDEAAMLADTEPTDEYDPSSPGQRLQRERLAQGLDEEGVAERLHITRHYLRAMEEDAYERLPGDVFARGYMRSYYLLLGVPKEPLMTLFEGRLKAARAAKAAQGVPKKRLTRADKHQRWLAVSLGVTIALFTGLCFFNS